MQRIVTLMNEKNHYLEKFYTLNEKELVNFAQGQFDNLEHFYQAREGMLEVIKYIDSQIEKVQTETADGEALEAGLKKILREAMAAKDEYVARIIEQDIQVLSCIEMAKNSIIRELQDVRKNKKGIGNYKAKTFHQRLDEEV